MFDSVEAAAAMISQRPAFEPESRTATVVGPLKDAKVEPDVVVLVDKPETIYWIIPASTYIKVEGLTLAAQLSRQPVPTQLSCQA